MIMMIPVRSNIENTIRLKVRAFTLLWIISPAMIPRQRKGSIASVMCVVSIVHAVPGTK